MYYEIVFKMFKNIKMVKYACCQRTAQQKLHFEEHFTCIQVRVKNPKPKLRKIEWFGLEGTLKITWFPPPCHGQGHLPPDQAAQSPVPPGLELCQGGGSHSFSGQPVPVPHHLYRKKEDFLMSSLNLHFFQFKLLPLVLSLQAVKKFSPSFLCAPLKYWKVVWIS